MSKYEGLFIFQDALKDDGLEQAISKVKAEVEKLNGSVEQVARMGRKPFARPIQKQTAGQFVIMNIDVDGDQVKELHRLLNVSEDVVRVQLLHEDNTAKPPEPSEEEEPTVEEEANAVS